MDKSYKKEILIYSTIVFLYIIFRYVKYFESELFVIWFDSAQYASLSLASIWTDEFWSDGVPPLYPFFLKYFHHFAIGSTLDEINFFSFHTFTPTIVKGIEKVPDFPYLLVKDNFDVISASLIQLHISILAWLTLAFSFSRIIDNTYLKIASILFILLLGAESSITLWDKHILTESIAISIIVFLFSILIHIPSLLSKRINLILVISILVSLSFIKIIYNYLILLLIPLIVFYFWQSNFKYKFQYSVILTTLLSLFILNQYMLFQGDRTHVPMKDLISSRISTEGYEDIYSYFRNKGMPEIPDVLINKLWTAPFEDFPEINDWWISKSSKTYQKYLITHPVYFFVRPFQDKNEYNKPIYSFFTPDLHFHEQVIKNKVELIFTDYFLWIISITSIFLVCIVRGKLDYKNLIIPVFILLCGCVLSLIIWHGDIGELDRHSIHSAIVFRIGLITLFLTLLNTLLKRNKKTN